MAYCGKCGSKLEDEAVKSCPACGASTELPPPDPSRPVYRPPIVPGAPMKADIRDAQENKVMAILAYLGPLVLIPLLLARESPFAGHHTNQGLVLFLAEAIYGIAYSLLSWILLAISWRLAFFLWIWGVGSIVFLVFAIIGILSASRGELKPLPLIGQIQLLK